jgi:hypothetical protein
MKSPEQPETCRFNKSFTESLFRGILIFLVLSVPQWVGGQKQEVDAVYLENGEIYRGRIQEHHDPDLVQLETLCLNTRLFPLSEILRIEKETVKLADFGGFGGASVHGYFNHTDLGFLIGSGNNEKDVVFSVQMVNGYKFRRKYYPGIGTGIEFYEQAYVPVYADFKYVLLNHRVSPFLRGSAGYSISLEDPSEEWGSRTDNHGGILYAAGIGTTIRTGSSSVLVISIVYRFQSLRSTYTEEWNEEILNLEKQFNRLAFRIGFIFD